MVEQLHLDKTAFTNWEIFSEEVYEQFTMDGLNSYVETIDQILKRTHPYPVIIYAGGWDFLDGPPGQEAWIDQLTWSGAQQLRESPRKLYYYETG